MSSTYQGESQGSNDEQERRSFGTMLGDISRDLTSLLRQEVELAKAEAKQSATNVGKGAGMFAGAAIAGLLFLVFISVSAWWGLGQFIGNQWSGLIVAVIWAIVAVVLAVVGKNELARIKGLAQTSDTVAKIPNALKGQEEKN